MFPSCKLFEFQFPPRFFTSCPQTPFHQHDLFCLKLKVLHLHLLVPSAALVLACLPSTCTFPPICNSDHNPNFPRKHINLPFHSKSVLVIIRWRTHKHHIMSSSRQCMIISIRWRYKHTSTISSSFHGSHP